MKNADESSGGTMTAALITGASRGIGAYVAEHLAQQGYHPILLARSEQKLKQLAKTCEKHHVSPVVMPCDVTDFDSVSHKLDEILPDTDLATAFINQGIAHFGSFLDDRSRRWHQVLETNLSGAMHLAQTVVPYLRQSSSTERSLIFTVSMAAKFYASGATAYCVSKHGLLAFAHCLYESVREDNIKVTSLCPGFVNTPLLNADHLDRDQMIQPADIAQAIDFVHNSSAQCCPVELQLKPQHSPYL